MDENIEILFDALPLVRNIEGRLTPFVDVTKEYIISLTYPTQIISKDRKGNGLNCLSGVMGTLCFTKEHIRKISTYRTMWFPDKLVITENGYNGKELNRYEFNYKYINDYIYKYK